MAGVHPAPMLTLQLWAAQLAKQTADRQWPVRRVKSEETSASSLGLMAPDR
jgi:hypothetical protein